MADDGVANGGVDYQYGEESATKIEVLQRERDELVNENASRKEEIKKLTAELDILRRDGAVNSEKIEEMQREVVQSRDAVKAAEVIAARAADLETDVAKLQHDLISEMTATEEARADASELRKDLGEKESLVESLEKELTALKKVKAEGEVRVRDLERKIGVLETKEIEERNKRIRFKEEMRDKVDEKEKEINGFKQKLVELEKVTAEKKSELEESVKQKLRLEEALKESEEKVAALESSILQLREEAKEVERVILLLNEKAVETVENIDRGLNGIHDEGKGLKLQWPVVAAGSTGAVVAAAAVIYVCYGKRK
ncbi:peroxisomal and mitochondrial division factor 2-like [Vigna umbellata]|uniref:peroxisomal and mitochondrial division factor 2-like n=1 Tax=Vigna umbellata TaxID=87088 RepID=UPI001F5EFB95|nr:peroxisomal and mitochondrial division factor 2-like [Vigna umbellata]